MSGNPCFIMNMARAGQSLENREAKPPVAKEKVMSYEEKSVGSTAFFKCEACPYMALAEDDIKFHLFTEHPELARTNGLADNIQIACPGCTSIFDAEETLRTHLRNHHKMGIKDVKKMVKSLVQIALKHAKLKREDKIEEPPPTISRQETPDMKMPEVIEITPDATHTITNPLPKGVAYISVDELQRMSTPNFEKVDPKDIIQEASINIVYTNEVGAQYVNVTEASVPTTCSIIQMQSVPPDLISSIQPRNIVVSMNSQTDEIAPTPSSFESTYPPIKPKPGRPYGARSRGISKSDGNMKQINVEEKLGALCSVDGCHVRLKDAEKLAFHRKCHSNGKYVCVECRNLFLCTETLHTHLWKAHGVDMDLPTCEICGYKTYKRHRLVNIHMKCHGTEKPFPCAICQKSFKNVAQLAKHKTTHSAPGPVQCPTCRLEFSGARRLAAHRASVHDRRRPHRCEECPYTAARKAELKLHMRVHTGDKPYSCEQCAYRSADHNAMRRHRKQHSKASLYSCKYCPYTTIQSTVFASHMISKHPTVCDTALHRCPYCAYKSVSKDKYVAHLTKHPDEEGIQLLIEMNKPSKPSWTIPSDGQLAPGPPAAAAAEPPPAAALGVFDCDSRREHPPQEYPTNYSTHPPEPPGPAAAELGLLADGAAEPRHLYAAPYEPACSPQPAPPPGPGAPGPPAGGGVAGAVTLPVRGNITLKPDDRIPLPMGKFTGPIILPAPSGSPGAAPEDGAPRKKPKISVKSNLVLKGPDQVNMFHSQQKMAFKQLEDRERFGLGAPVTFNNLIAGQYMLPEPGAAAAAIFPPPPLLPAALSPPLLPPPPKPADPSYIKLEGAIKQNTPSPSLELGPLAAGGYKASPPPDDLHKNLVKSELKPDYFGAPLAPAAASVLDQYLLDNLEPYPAHHLDLSSIVMVEMGDERASDVIEIDDNSDDTKLPPRYDIGFPLDQLYLMHNDFHFLDGEVPEPEPRPEVPREAPEADGFGGDYPNFIEGKQDPMMNTSVKPVNKINVKNIELMKN